METKVEYKTEQVEEQEQKAPSLEDLMDDYEYLCWELAEDLQRLADLKAQIVERVKARGETVEHGNVKATYRQGYTRTTWDNKALDGFAAAHPEILPFRKETMTGPSVSIKLVN